LGRKNGREPRAQRVPLSVQYSEVRGMSQNFAEVVEEVKQLSPAEKVELQQLLRQYLIEDRRHEILENYEAGLEELHKGELTSFSDADKLLDSLSDD
jgi:hypothetical protein